MPVFEGYGLPHAVMRLDIAGRDVTAWFSTLLRDKGQALTNSAEKEIVREMKEKLTYVAEDYDAELKAAEESSEIEQTYELPDGKVVTVGAERFKCPECLFQPSMLGKEDGGIHEKTFQSIQKCDVDVR